MNTRVIDLYIEIYGGGNWITESYPTNFHTFVKRRVVKTESEVANYKEVNDSQKEALEKTDAAWVEPSAELIARWNDRCYIRFGAGSTATLGQYNPKTGFFEYGSLKDIPTNSALLALKIPQYYYPGNALTGYLNLNFILPIKVANNNGVDSCNIRMDCCRNVETVAFYTYYSVYTQTDWYSAFYDCIALKEILIPMTINKPHKDMFTQCRALESVKIMQLKSDLIIKDTPVLSLESVAYMVAEAKNTTDITITVHPEVYAKLTDESNAEWHAVAISAAEKNITFATTT